MQNLWNDAEAAGFGSSDLGQRVYSSRLLGRDATLVLDGGGSTSIKVNEKDIGGGARDILYVKGSGWDLATIEPRGFSPVRLDHLRRLVSLPDLSDSEMSNEMLTHLTAAGAPAPSVEDYKTNNLLKLEVTSRDVGELAAELCGPLFSKTTAAQIPVDGGNERVV